MLYLKISRASCKALLSTSFLFILLAKKSAAVSELNVKKRAKKVDKSLFVVGQ